MKYKILAVLCVFCMLAGCKIELPAQASSAPANSAESSRAVSAQTAGSSSEVSSAQAGSTASAVSSAAASAASKAVNQAAASSAPVSKTPAASKPAAPAASQAKEQSCTLSISCSDILKNAGKFSADQLSAVPKDGIIYAAKSIRIQDGDTVFDVLLRETKANGIPMDHAASPAFQTEYIKGIANIYEKDFGATSGWMYVVNGKQPAVGCGSYKLKSGDKIQWIFQCGT